MQIGIPYGRPRRSYREPDGTASVRPERSAARSVPAFLRPFPWSGASALLFLGTGLLAGCSPSTPQSVFDSRSTLAWAQQNLFVLIIVMAAVVFVVVEGALVYAIWRFRGRPGQGIPAQVHGSPRLEVAWTIAPAVVLAIIGVPTVATIFETARVPTTGDPLHIRVIGHQWWWEFQYPEQKIVTANEFHIPGGRPVVLSLESADVIHSFWIPKLGGKRDVVPGHTNNIVLVAEPPPAAGGEQVSYLGQCVEFCGTSHANMRALAVVHTPADFEAWVRAQQAPVTAPLPEAFTKFASVRREQERKFPGSGPASSCLVCHSIEGTSARGAIGPNLTHLGRRQTIAAGLLATTEENIAKWIRDPGAVKPGAKMPALDLSEAEVTAIAKYLANLK